MASKDQKYVSSLDPNRTVWLRTLVRQGRRRLFLQRLWRVLGLAAASSMAIAAVGFALCRLEIMLPKSTWLLLLLPWTVALIFAVPWRIPDIEMARRVDHANQLGDRLSSAIAFLNKDERSEWIDKQIDDAIKRIENETERNRLLKQTFERQPLAFRSASLVLLAVSVALFILPGVAHTIRNKHVPIVENSNDGEKQKPNLDAAAHTLRQAQVEKMIESAEEIHDDALKNAAEELRQILKEDQEGKLSPEAFQKRLDALQNKLAQLDRQNQIPSADEQRAIDQAVKEALQTLTQMKEDPETKNLADALEQNDYDKAADILRDLLNSTDPEDKKKLEKLSKMFGDLAKNLDPTDPKLKEALQKNKDLVEQLQKEFDNEKLSDEDRKNFMDAAKKLRDEQKQTGNQQNSNQNNDNNASKTIDALQKAFEKQSKQLDQAAKSQSTVQQTKPGDEQNPSAQQTKPGDEQNPSAQQTKPGDEQNPSAQQTKPGDEQNPSARQTETGDEQNPSARQTKPGDEQNPSARQTETGDEQNPSARQTETGDEPSSSDDESPSPAEETLRDMASQKAAQQQRDELQKIADKMKQDAEHHQNQNEDDGDDAERNRQKNMQDFLERAQGKQPHKDSEASKEKNEQNQEQAQQGQEQAQQGQEQAQQGQEQAQQGQQQAQQGQEQAQQGQQQAQQGQQQAQQGQQQGSQQAQQDGSRQGQQQGTETLAPQGTQNGDHDTSEGAPTSVDVQYKDETLAGMDSGESESTGDVIESAGQKGFASESYKKVYQTYEKSAESVLESDDVPQGYKNYIRRYFDMIQPQ